MTSQELSRRAVLAAACGTCAAAVAGCATYTSGRAAPSPSPAPTGAGSGLGVPGTPAPGATGGAAVVPGGAPLAATTDIPVGGGKIFADQDVVVTQPTAGRFVAFSATCTHQGCTVATVTGNTVNCPCHGSKFALADGSVVSGPAPGPLPGKTVRVSGGQIRLA